ncbi:MAG: NusG domain II-containing protein [Aerococcus sp.]|nr:NusG domain II-containing protein [Aerococcus sp.]
MKQILKKMKIFDFILIGLVIVFSFAPNVYTYLTYSAQGEENAPEALVKVNGEVVAHYTLEKNGQHIIKTYYPHDGQYNIIELDNDRIRIKEDNSPDQIGVRTGWISRPGQTAVCLPHNVVIEVTGSYQDDELILPLS